MPSLLWDVVAFQDKLPVSILLFLQDTEEIIAIFQGGGEGKVNRMENNKKLIHVD